VVEVVLAVVLLAVDALALHVLGMLDAGLFLGRHLAVGGGLVLHVLHPLLALLHAGGLLLGQRAGLHALVDALLLVGLALVDARGGRGLGQRRQGHGGGQQGGGDRGRFHASLL
jgi:hypothetical protein